MTEIKNAKIIKADLSMADHGILTLELVLEGDGWGCVFGGRVLGKGYLDAKNFEGSPKGIEEIMRIMNVVGVNRFSELTGKCVRVIVGKWGDTITTIGNIIKDKWFDYNDFYKEVGDC